MPLGTASDALEAFGAARQRLFKRLPAVGRTANSAIDVVVVRQRDGARRATPFHARFGRRARTLALTNDNEVDLFVNDRKIEFVEMRVGEAGEAFFEADAACTAEALEEFADDAAQPFEESNSVSWSWGSLPRQVEQTKAEEEAEEEDVEEEDEEMEGAAGTSRREVAVSLTRRTVQALRRSYVDWRQRQQQQQQQQQHQHQHQQQHQHQHQQQHQQQQQCRPARSARMRCHLLQQLPLKPGRNRLVYRLRREPSELAECDLYLWRYDDRIVVSDIDGTVTRSTLLGHVMPIIGRDWSQPSIAQLFTAVGSNGYRLLYLSSRGIGQSRGTRELLEGVNQEGESLPDGPILLSPQSLIRVLHSEVMPGRSQKFKFDCLADIASLFQGNRWPLWAGFGNRQADIDAYIAAGIPQERCFIITNSSGIIRSGLSRVTSYRQLAEAVEIDFPRLSMVNM